jgi:creatinine amidohydrolase
MKQEEKMADNTQINPVRYWQTLTTDDFAASDFSNTITILPVAAIEQHGPHLPLDVDAAINTAVIEASLSQIPSDLSVLVLPAQNVGYSEEHSSFPGTLTLDAETLLRVWRQMGECVARVGIRKLVMFNSHGGQNELMGITARQLRVSEAMFVATASWSRLVSLEDIFEEEELRFGIHGGAVETSLMLHIAPDRVRTDQIVNFRSTGQKIAEQSKHLSATGRVAYGWMTEDLNSSGAVGDPRSATAELGQEILSRATKGLVQLLEDVAKVEL